MSLRSYLKDIADAIREKTGKTDKINAKDFATEIKNIQSGGGSENTDTLKALLDYTKNTSYMFYNNTTITDLSGYIKKNYTENVTNMSNMFYNCSSLTSIPDIDTSKVTDMSSMFNSCSSLTSIPDIDTSKVTKMSNMFVRCSALTSIPKMNTSNVTNMGYMFYGCKALTTIPKLDTSKVTNMTRTFSDCSNLTTIPELDISNVTSMSYMFNSCKALTNLTLYNIKGSLSVGQSKLLTQESLIHTCKECIKQSSAKTLTVSSASKTILDSVYVRFTDSSVTTIAVGEKGDVTVCESTDTGAMTIAAYMSLKSWTISAY